MNKNTIAAVLIIAVVGLGGYALLKNRPSPVAKVSETTPLQIPDTVKTPCPFLMAENGDFKIFADQCNPEKTPEGVVLQDQYTTPTLTVRSTDGSFKQTYELLTKFGGGADFVAGGLQTDQSKSYLFMDEGTWVVRSLTIFSLKDNRVKQIQYMSSPVLTKNGYLVYNAPSQIYPDAHPEVDQSAASDVIAIKLLDLSTKYLFKGDTKTDYSVFVEKLPSENIIANLPGDFITINKAVFNDPAHYDAGLVRTQFTVPISQL